ncbi:hypothetical protein BJY00DRAFT_298414 [Aspergillus carlsbadensis]|nr:hypothetical protein BJY00DRAFT_298414 [Aspergillus carlsbadensis]
MIGLFTLVPLELEVTPGGEKSLLNGTVEEVHGQLPRLNPNWDDEFTTPATDESHEDSDFVLVKRTDFSDTNYFCEKSVQGVGGRPGDGAGPGACARVSCSYDSAIYWCNDDPNGKLLESYGSIADGAERIMVECVAGSDLQCTGGQTFHKTNWNVIVREDSC